MRSTAPPSPPHDSIVESHSLLDRQNPPVNGTLLYLDDVKANTRSETTTPGSNEWFACKGKTGTGWGFGWAFDLTDSFAIRGRNLTGMRRIQCRVNIPAGKRFHVFLSEAGHLHSGSPLWDDTAYSSRIQGADGESYTSPELIGEGVMRDYNINVADLVRRAVHGNPDGKNKLDLAAIATIDVFFPGGQGAVSLALGPITAEP